ncbi:hypothetical protein [Pedococcus sp. 2YAF34]|uniref:hypothetical protein n=1 Tax=Pedococcus sp. 2YAF34 TaxID=3233032 RepID=UPI003F973516
MTRPATTSPARRARHLARIYLSESPTLYLPLARRRYPGPSPEVIGRDTELVIDGYTRCASTFVVHAFQLAQPRPVRLAHHLHASSQIVEAVRRGVPTLTVIREPRGAVLSQLVREPDVDLRDAMLAYARFYEQLMPHRDAMVVSDFPESTHDLATVVRRLNGRFGTTFATPSLDADMREEVAELVRARPTLSPVVLGFESGLVSHDELLASRGVVGGAVTYGGVSPAGSPELWAPSAQRDQEKAALAGAWTAAPRRLRERALCAYAAFTVAPGAQAPRESHR